MSQLHDTLGDNIDVTLNLELETRVKFESSLVLECLSIVLK